MSTIAERTEEDIDYKGRFKKRDIDEQPNVTSAISHAPLQPRTISAL